MGDSSNVGVALGALAGGLGKAYAAKKQTEHDDSLKHIGLVSGLVSAGMQSGMIENPNEAFAFLLSQFEGGGKKGKKGKGSAGGGGGDDLPGPLQSVLAATTAAGGGGGGGTPLPKFTTPAEARTRTTATATATADAASARQIKEVEATTKITGAQRLKEIDATAAARYGPGTIQGRINAEIDKWRAEHNGAEPTEVDMPAIIDKARTAWQSAGKTPPSATGALAERVRQITARAGFVQPGEDPAAANARAQQTAAGELQQEQRARANNMIAVQAGRDLDAQLKDLDIRLKGMTVAGGGLTPGQTISEQDRLRENWNKFMSPTRAREEAVAKIDQGLRALAEGDRRSAAEIIQTAFVKMQDEGVAVREGDYARIADGVSIPGRIEGALKRFEKGGPPIPDSDLVKLANEAKATAQGLNQVRQLAVNEYKQAIEQGITGTNIKPEAIFGGTSVPLTGVKVGDVRIGPDGKKHKVIRVSPDGKTIELDRTVLP